MGWISRRVKKETKERKNYQKRDGRLKVRRKGKKNKIAYRDRM